MKGGRRRKSADRWGRRVSLISKRGRFLVAEPFFEPGPEVAIDKRARKAVPGRLALVETRPGGARVLAGLGDPELARDVVDGLLMDRGVERDFSERVELEAGRAIERLPRAAGSRRNLTDLPTFTVDPATAHDFDDAVSATRDGEVVRLWIHIADVAAYVRPGSALDEVAYERSTSTYVPGGVAPMLPLALSGDVCSLVPGEERLAVTAEIVLSPDGEPRSASFHRTLVRSDARLNYDELDEIFAGRKTAPAPVRAPLDTARAVAATLAARRPASSLTVEGSEPQFDFDAGGDVAEAHAVEQTESHRLIEQLMILTNEQVAALLERKGVPALYRVHESPDPQRIEALCEQLAALGVPTPPVPERLSPRQASELAGEASRLVAAEVGRRGHGAEAYTSLVLRSLKQAYYSDRNVGHAGLGSPAYAHFTSPIRRYPDLVDHRALLAVLGEDEQAPRRDRVRDAGPHSSAREREAMQVERDADDVCAAFLLRRELFDSGWRRSFEGEVVGVIGGGAFVRFAGELADVYEGFLPARRLSGERFELNRTETAMVGQRSGLTVRLGDPVEVRVERVAAERGRVDLVPAEAGPPKRGRP